MKIVFFGTPEYVLPILNKLNKYHEIVAVVTQPPKPVGRDKKITYSAVDNWAHKRKIPIYFDSSDLPSADLGILASYGGLLEKDCFNHFPKGILVVHPSLLPQFRWSSPVQAAILTGTNPTGVTVFKMDDKFDHGPIVAQSKEDVLESDTNETLRNRLFEKSADILLEALEPYVKGKITLKQQDDTKATFARIIKKEDAFVPLEFIKNLTGVSKIEIPESWEVGFLKNTKVDLNAKTLNNFIKAMQPWPIAWTIVTINETQLRLKLISSHVENNNLLVLDTVQLEGKNPVIWKQFQQAYNI